MPHKHMTTKRKRKVYWAVLHPKYGVYTQIYQTKKDARMDVLTGFVGTSIVKVHITPLTPPRKKR